MGEAKNVRERALLTTTISIIITPTLVMTPPLLLIAALMTAMTMSSILSLAILTTAVAASMITPTMTNSILIKFVSRGGILLVLESKVFANI